MPGQPGKVGQDVVLTPQQQQQQDIVRQAEEIINDPFTSIVINRPPPNPFAGGPPRYPKPRTVIERPHGPFGPSYEVPAPLSARVKLEEAVTAFLGTVSLGVGTVVGLAPERPQVPPPGSNPSGVHGGTRPAKPQSVIESIVVGTVPSDRALDIERANPVTQFVEGNPEAIQTLAGRKLFNTIIEKAFLTGAGLVGKVVSTTGIDEALVGTAGANEEAAIAQIKAAEAAGNAVVVAVNLARPFVFPGQNVAQALLFRDP